MNVTDSNKIQVEFKEDIALLSQQDEVTERVQYDINQGNKELQFHGYDKTIFTFGMSGNSVLNITTNDSVALHFRSNRPLVCFSFYKLAHE